MFKYSLALTLLFSSLITTAASADGVRFWKTDSRKDLLAGETEGVSVLADESLSLAPEIKPFAQPKVPHIWAMAADGHGGVYLGTGHEGIVYRVDSAGDTTVVFDALEPEITSLAVTKSGDLFVGASPEGRVYRIPRGSGEAEIYFDPEETYIWKMLAGPGGELYVAVGLKGGVYKVTGNGQAKVVLETEEQHILSLALDHKGNLLAGSAGNALIYQVTPGGEASIVYDSPLNDIRSIVVDNDNNLFVAALEIKSGAEQGQNVFSQPNDMDGPADGKKQEQSNQEGQELKRGMIMRPPAVRMAPPTNSEIYYFDQDRFVTRIWRESGDAIMALGLSPDGQAMFVASKDKRSLYKINKRGELTLINKFGSGEVTDFLDLGGRILICTHSPGRVHVLEPGYMRMGKFTSEVQKAGIPAQWGTLSWLGETPSGTKVSFRTRSGNTDKPDTTWSAWSAPINGTPGETITSPVRRNFQWQVTLETSKPLRTPRLNEVSVSYLRRNRAPMISPVRLMPQGLYIKPSATALEGGGDKQKYPVEVALLMESSNGGTDNPFQGKKEYDRKMRMAGWNANDANGDRLAYSVYYKGVQENTWRPLAQKTESNAVIFDTESIADGRYLIKVVAFDSLDNAESRAMNAERLSSPFFVDNTAPMVKDLAAKKQADGSVVVSFRVEDVTTRIERVELTLDSEPAKLLAPDDSLLDTQLEGFHITLDKPENGEHTISIMAWDRFYNRTAARISFKSE
ncbi:hypothetical protein ACFL4X_00815 [Gemmatimonadota bacterium]